MKVKCSLEYKIPRNGDAKIPRNSNVKIGQKFKSNYQKAMCSYYKMIEYVFLIFAQWTGTNCIVTIGPA